ncbi:MAG: hypothetical protein AAGH19_05905 [Pseudomonadota bacterium]
MSTSRRIRLALAVSALALSTGATAQDEPSLQEILERLEALERVQAEQADQLRERDQRIAELEAELAAQKDADTQPADTVAPIVAEEAPAPAEPPAAVVTIDAVEPADAPLTPVVVAAEPVDVPEGVETDNRGRPIYEAPEYYGEFQDAGRGFKLVNTPVGDLSFSLYTSVRYLNQSSLDETYTDSFGRTTELDLRNDLQFQKVLLYFKGWVLDPKFRYLTYVWTSNTSQGLGAQVVVAGNLSYLFNESFNLGAGIGGLPTTRSTEGNFPRWLKSDVRTIADDFFRGSFTSGIWAYGKLGEHWRYHAMLGNNLSQLGVDAGQLDNTMDTYAGALIWTPMGPYNKGFGDYENTEDTAVRVGLHYTHSTEDRQSQPGVDDPDNSQLRLSDGTLLFRPGAFATEGRINRARYRMTSIDAGIKRRGLALEGEFYYRILDDFLTEGFVPVDEDKSHGYQVQASAMVVPRLWQLYLAHSKVYGDYGDPWDAALGVNWFPYKNSQFRVNGELLYLDRSPVGNYSAPYIVGGNGLVYYANLEYRF